VKSVVPIVGESLNSLLHRWAAANFIDSMIDVTGHGGVEYPNAQDAALNERRDLASIAERVGLSISELERRRLPLTSDGLSREINGTIIRKTDLEVFERRFAPASLSISPHHRTTWMVRTISFCPESWQYLQNRCHRSSCGALQGWVRTFGIDRCDRCLADLSQGAGGFVPEPERAALTNVVNLFSPCPEVRKAALAGLSPALDTMTTAAAYELLIRIMKVIDPQITLSRTTTHLGQPEALSSSMAKAWEILSHWPHAFLDLAADRLAPRHGRDDGNEGETMRFLNLWRSRSTPADPIVCTVAEKLCRSVDIADPANEGRFIGLSPAAAQLGLKQSRLSTLRRDGVLKTKFAIRRDRPLASFCPIEIASLNDGCKDRISLETARSQLGISAHGVEQLLALRLIDEVTHPYFKERYHWRPVSRQSVEGLCRRLEEFSQILGVETVRLPIAMTSIGGRLKPWGVIFERFLDGGLDYELEAGPGPLVRRIKIAASAVPVLAEVHFDPTLVTSDFAVTMSKRDAAETLNLGPVQATALLSSQYTPRGSRSPVVPHDDVQRLAQRYISTAELSWRLGKSKQAAYFAAKAAGVKQIYPGGFCRSDAIALLNLS